MCVLECSEMECRADIWSEGPSMHMPLTNWRRLWFHAEKSNGQIDVFIFFGPSHVPLPQISIPPLSCYART